MFLLRSPIEKRITLPGISACETDVSGAKKDLRLVVTIKERRNPRATRYINFDDLGYVRKRPGRTSRQRSIRIPLRVLQKIQMGCMRCPLVMLVNFG